MEHGGRRARFLAAATILLLLGTIDAAVFDWRGTLALRNLITHSVEKQAETAETKVAIYDALWGGLLGVPAKKQ